MKVALGCKFVSSKTKCFKMCFMYIIALYNKKVGFSIKSAVLGTITRGLIESFYKKVHVKGILAKASQMFLIMTSTTDLHFPTDHSWISEYLHMAHSVPLR